VSSRRDVVVVGGGRNGLVAAAYLTLGQMYHARPAAGYADLRTPVRGLYQAGSATHGGGGVTGIPGRNVVRQLRAGRGAARWRRRGGSRTKGRR
jgi:phytoene dehydrogenase-like protein